MFTARPRRTSTCGQRREQGRAGLGIRGPRQRGSSYDAPDDKGDFKLVGEAEDGEAEEGKHACLCKGNAQKRH